MKMQEVDGLKMVKEFAEEMENMLGRKMKSVKVGDIRILSRRSSYNMIKFLLSK